MGEKNIVIIIVINIIRTSLSCKQVIRSYIS